MSAFLLAAVLSGLMVTGPDPALVADDPATEAASEVAPQTADEKKPPTPPETGVHGLFAGLINDVKHLPSQPNLNLAFGGAVLALASHPADAKLNAELASRATAADAFWKPGHIVGNTYVQVGASLLTFGYGQVFHAPKVGHLGMDLLRAQLIAGGLTGILKVTVRRERPDHSNAFSFPSGHAAATFAAATVIERHLGWQYAGIGYAIAAYVATSRLHDNVHVLSDVVFGSAIGAIAGRTVTQHGRKTWSLTPALTRDGAAILITREAW